MKNVISYVGIAGLLVLFCDSALASVSKINNGGIDVTLPDGARVPIEAYLENNSRAVPSVCDLVSIDGQSGDSAKWHRAINDVLKETFNVLPGLAHTLVDAFNSSNFYLLELADGAKLYYTDDDGRLIETDKENGAVRMQQDVYILSSAWRNYWRHRSDKYPYQNMLTRVLHEALIPYQSKQSTNKYVLGKIVVEILRLAGVYDKQAGHPNYTLVGKGSKELSSRLLYDLKLKPGKAVGWQFGYGITYFERKNSESIYKPGRKPRDKESDAYKKYLEKTAKWTESVAGWKKTRQRLASYVKRGKLGKDKQWNDREDFDLTLHSKDDLKLILDPALFKEPVYLGYPKDADTEEDLRNIYIYKVNQKRIDEARKLYSKPPQLCK